MWSKGSVMYCGISGKLCRLSNCGTTRASTRATNKRITGRNIDAGKINVPQSGGTPPIEEQRIYSSHSALGYMSLFEILLFVAIVYN